jgi:para-aminobenzoate synthetase/4-amino-4-deoxychorismate lyase
LIRPGGDSIFNVAIRTLVLDSATGTARLGVGAGITYDSDAESEYAECLLKGEFVKTAGERFELLESILLDNGDYFLLARHLDRLKASAHYFAYPYNEPVIREKLRETAGKHGTAQWKVRLILDASGRVTCSTQSLLPRTSILRVGVANGPVNSDDRSLYHKKTTNLERWQAELREHPDWDDLILWNERGDVTESTIANVVIRRGENLITPRRESGLLAGTFREELLESGEIVEDRISLAELQGTGEFYLINSVQKWRRAVLKR